MQPYTQTETLTILTHSPADQVKLVAESVIPQLGEIRVLQNRTGLVMLPYTDSAEGTIFHLGEVLVSEAHIRLSSDVEGYAVVTGRDLEQAMAIAVLDAALTAQISMDEIMRFVAEQSDAQRQTDQTLLRQVQATRIEMETF